MDTQVRLECRNGNATTRQLCDLSQVIAIEDGTLFKLSDSWFWSTLAWLWRCWRDFIEPVWLFLDYRSCREVTIRCHDYAVILSNLDSSSANLVRELPSVSIYVTHCLRPRSCRLCHKSFNSEDWEARAQKSLVFSLYSIQLLKISKLLRKWPIPPEILTTWTNYVPKSLVR